MFGLCIFYLVLNYDECKVGSGDFFVEFGVCEWWEVFFILLIFRLYVMYVRNYGMCGIELVFLRLKFK